MNKPLIDITDFKGMLSLNDRLGRKDQLSFGYGLDFTSKKGSVGPRVDWAQFHYNTSSTSEMGYSAQALLYAISNGNVYRGDDHGQIMKQSDSGTISDFFISSQSGAIRG